MCIKRYYTARGMSSIRTVIIDRETSQSVWINGSRRLKRGGWDNYYNTFEEAKEAMTEKARLSLEGCIKRLKKAEVFLRKIQSVTRDSINKKIEPPT